MTTSTRPLRVILHFSIPLALVVAIASVGGLVIPELYARETPSWRLEAYAQDLYDLVILVPLLLLTAWRTVRGSRPALAAWFGVMAFSLYTFVLYCFAVHFNAMFPVYCAALGLAAYGILAAVRAQCAVDVAGTVPPDLPRRAAAAYLLLLTTLFAFLWITDIASAIAHGSVPPTILERGLLTNPVHVLDLALLLPAFALTGIALLRRHPWAGLAAPALLFFSGIMAASIGLMAFLQARSGVGSAMPVAIGMGVNALVGVLLFARMARRLRASSAPQ